MNMHEYCGYGYILPVAAVGEETLLSAINEVYDREWEDLFDVDTYMRFGTYESADNIESIEPFSRGDEIDTSEGIFILDAYSDMSTVLKEDIPLVEEVLKTLGLAPFEDEARKTYIVSCWQ